MAKSAFQELLTVPFHRRTLAGAAAAAAAAAVGVLTSCTSASPTPQSGAADRGGGASSAGEQPQPVRSLLPFGRWRRAESAPAEEQVLRLNLGAEPDTIDPQAASTAAEISVVMRVFANLLKVNDKGEIVPEMTEQMPVVSADGKTVTCTLKPGLKYSDGQPLSAKNFEYGWKRHLDPRSAGEYAYTGFILEGAEELFTAKETDTSKLSELRDAVGVRAQNDRTLEFRLKRPAPWFVSVLATWCGLPTRQDAVEQGGQRWTEPATYVGNGPYVLRSWDPQNSMSFEANPYYHRGAPRLKAVRLAMIKQPAAELAAYGNGELDVMAVRRDDLEVVDSDSQLKQQHQRFAGNGSFYVGFNARQAPFDNMLVRKAFAAAINRQDFVNSVLGGLALPAGQFVPPRFPGYFASLNEQKFDPVQARSWLALAGFADARTMPPVRFMYVAVAPGKARIDALVEQLKRHLSVDVVPEAVEARVFTTLMKSQDTTPQLFLHGWGQDYPHPQNWYSTVFHSQATVSHTGWESPDFDRWVQQADVELDQSKRTEAYKKAAQVLVDEAPVAFLFHAVTSRLVKPHVSGLTQNPLEHFAGQSTLEQLRILKH